jgi:hypothetical protein
MASRIRAFVGPPPAQGEADVFYVVVRGVSPGIYGSWWVSVRAPDAYEPDALLQERGARRHASAAGRPPSSPGRQPPRARPPGCACGVRLRRCAWVCPPPVGPLLNLYARLIESQVIPQLVCPKQILHVAQVPLRQPLVCEGRISSERHQIYDLAPPSIVAVPHYFFDVWSFAFV